MDDFTSKIWPWYIGIIVITSIVAVIIFVWRNTERRAPGAVAETKSHVWDENLQEYDNPLPGWWLNLFYITLAFGIIYLILYPGLGFYSGALHWTSDWAQSPAGEAYWTSGKQTQVVQEQTTHPSQYTTEMQAAQKEYGPLYAKYENEDIKALAKNPQAMQTGERLFANYCTMCHGSDARGAPGFPNLRDHDWLWGGTPKDIETTILDGRGQAGVLRMPSWKATLGEQGVVDVANYVLSLSGRQVDAQAAAAGKAKFETICAACHGANGKGNQALGAPNLTDNIWLYGGSLKTVEKTIADGRGGVMPTWKDFLGKAKVHLLAAYIYSLSNQ